MLITIGNEAKRIDNTEILTAGGDWYVAHNSDGEVMVWPDEDEADARGKGYTEAASIKHGFCAAVAFVGDKWFSAWVGPCKTEDDALDELALVYPGIADALSRMRRGNEPTVWVETTKQPMDG